MTRDTCEQVDKLVRVEWPEACSAAIQVGALVRYRYGGEAWAFATPTARDKCRKVLAIWIKQAANGTPNSVWLRLEGRKAPISLGEVVGVAS